MSQYETDNNELMDVDAMMDARYGKVGTPERERFRQEAYTFCVGNIIRDARRDSKVTQADLAARVGSTKSYISRIEHGTVEPVAGLFLRILAALCLRFDILKPTV